MRIGMVTACYKPVINGVTRMVSLYKHHLEAAGHEVTVFTLGEPDPAGDDPGVIRSPAIPLGSSGYYFSFGYSRAAQDLLSQMDIIHCHHLFMSAEMAHRYGNCPIVYTNHTRYDLYTGSYMALPQPAADAIMRQVWPEFTDLADVVITPTETVRQVMLEFGVRRPIEVIENGVDLRPFHDPPHPIIKEELGVPDSAVLLAYVGRLAPEKGLGSLLSQFAVAQDVLPVLHLLLIGSGPSKDELVRQASKLGVAEHVHFTGSVAYERVADYLAAADLFATASVTEVHPLTIIEALAAGLPVVAIDSPGISDTVESGKSGLLTRRPAGGLAASMVALAYNEEKRQQMSQAARMASARFDINRTVAKTLELYQRMRAIRPDLKREREHGRWLRYRERIRPILEQLEGLLHPGERLGTGPLKRLSGDASSGEDKTYDRRE